jgi:uncharacterized membrane protein YdjX (TVP38/TMEM64 family)
MGRLLETFQKKKGLRRYIGPKRIAILCVFTIFIIWAWSFYKNDALNPNVLVDYQKDNPVVGVVIFIFVYAVSTFAALPTLPLNLAAGFFWGGILGGIYSTIGVTLGGWISFKTARWFIGQPLSNTLENKWASKVQEEFKRIGIKFVAFARINPIIPTGPLNYLLGLTSLSNWDFLWVSFIFLLPPSIVVSYVGDSFQSFSTQETGVADIIRLMLIVSAAVTFLALIKFFATIYQRRSEKK